jgi:amidohydrolase
MRTLMVAAVAVALARAQTLEEAAERLARQLQAKTIECRRDLHMHPELSNQEERTGRVVAERLRAIGFTDVRTGVGGHGVVATLKGALPGPVVAWRADMDALPIDESNFAAPYRSTVKGVKHACGHDAHTAMGLALAEVFFGLKDRLPGTVKFLFQPAEEVGQGARRMIAEGALENPRPEAIFAYHVSPVAKVGEVQYTDGPASSATVSVKITIRGKRAHGAYPYQGIDAVAIASQCIVALQGVHSRQIDAQNPSVLSLGTIHGGDRRNVIAESVTLEGTVRTLSNAVVDEYEAKIERTLKGCTGAMGGSFELQYRRGTPAMVNSAALNRAAMPAVEAVFGQGKMTPAVPGLFGEDFAYFQKEIPGTMLLLGVRNEAKGITAPIHSAEFDMDEAALGLGVRAAARMLIGYLNGGSK